jgi:hypothetical protein
MQVTIFIRVENTFMEIFIQLVLIDLLCILSSTLTDQSRESIFLLIYPNPAAAGCQEKNLAVSGNCRMQGKKRQIFRMCQSRISLNVNRFEQVRCSKKPRDDQKTVKSRFSHLQTGFYSKIIVSLRFAF